jgi:hypothetical protein
MPMPGPISRRSFTEFCLAAAAATACPPALVAAHAAPHPAVADETARAMRAFAARLSPQNRQRTVRAFDDPARTNWHYTPRRRPGATLGQLSENEQRALWDLLGALLSPRGIAQVEGVIRLERVLGELSGNLSFRDPDNYAIVLFGDPAQTGPVLIRFEGHHLSLTAVVVPGVGVSVTPGFFGANPAKVPDRHAHKGFRLLGREEDQAFELIRSLEGDARQRAIIADSSLGDIVAGPGREDRLKRFEGAPLSSLSEGQRTGVFNILHLFTGTMRKEIAASAIERVRGDGADRLYFAWAGSLERGRPHYFRVHGPSVLIEYDNTQNGANHVHAVWIDPAEMFGRDILKRHHRQAH